MARSIVPGRRAESANFSAEVTANKNDDPIIGLHSKIQKLTIFMNLDEMKEIEDLLDFVTRYSYKDED